MSDININKQGQFITDLDNIKYLVNNFSISGNTTGWTLTNGTLSNGTVTMTGVNPTIFSPYFNIGVDDIICIEWTVAVPTPSTTTSGPGLYLGTPTSQGVFVHTFNHNTKIWANNTTANNNPYFLNSYNLTSVLSQKHYIVGANVDLNDIPWGESSNVSYPARIIQFPSNITSTRLRSGYNSNTSMTITLKDVKIYNITQRGFYDNDNIITAKIGKNWSQANNFYEY